MGLGAKTWYPANDERNGNYRLIKAEQRAHSQYVDELQRIQRLRDLREQRDLVSHTSRGGMASALNFPIHGQVFQPAAYRANHSGPHPGDGGPFGDFCDNRRASNHGLNGRSISNPAGGNNSAANQASHQQGGAANHNDQQSKSQGRGQDTQSSSKNDARGGRSTPNGGQQQNSGQNQGNKSNSPKQTHQSSNNQSAKNMDGTSKSFDNAGNGQRQTQTSNMQSSNDTYATREQTDLGRMNTGCRVGNGCTCSKGSRVASLNVQAQNHRHSTNGNYSRNDGGGLHATPVSILRNANFYGASSKLSDFSPQYLDSGSSTYKPFKPRSPLERDLFGEYDSIYRGQHQREMRDLNLRLGDMALTGSRRSSVSFL